jgi:hypothetical protein
LPPQKRSLTRCRSPNVRSKPSKLSRCWARSRPATLSARWRSAAS